MEPDNPALDDFVLGLNGRSRPKICFLPTATGNVAPYIVNFYEALRGRAEPSHLDLFTRTGPDVRSFVLDQHAIYVGGGSTANLLAIWRAHGLDIILGDAWRKGIVPTTGRPSTSSGPRSARSLRRGPGVAAYRIDRRRGAAERRLEARLLV